MNGNSIGLDDYNHMPESPLTDTDHEVQPITVIEAGELTNSIMLANAFTESNDLSSSLGKLSSITNPEEFLYTLLQPDPSDTRKLQDHVTKTQIQALFDGLEYSIENDQFFTPNRPN